MMKMAAFVLLSGSILAGLITAAAFSTSGDHFEQTFPGSVALSLDTDAVRCALTCTQDTLCDGFFYNPLSRHCDIQTGVNQTPPSTDWLVYLKVQNSGTTSAVTTTSTTTTTTTTTTPAPTTTTVRSPSWGGTISTTCYSYSQQIEYMGTINSAFGTPCLHWEYLNVQFADSKFPEGSGVAAQNYCRAVNTNFGMPYCYVVADIYANGAVKMCDVPSC